MGLLRGIDVGGKIVGMGGGWVGIKRVVDGVFKRVQKGSKVRGVVMFLMNQFFKGVRRYSKLGYIPGKDAEEELVPELVVEPESLRKVSGSWQDYARLLYGREYNFGNYDWRDYVDVYSLISDLEGRFGDHPVRRRMLRKEAGDLYVELEDRVKYLFDLFEDADYGNIIVLGDKADRMLSFVVGDRIACEVEVGDRLCVRGRVKSWEGNTVRLEVFDVFLFHLTPLEREEREKKEEKEGKKVKKNA